MDADGMENLSSSSLGCVRGSVLGDRVECASSVYYMGRTHGLPLLARYSRSDVRPCSASLLVILLPQGKTRIASWYFPLRVSAGQCIWWSSSVRNIPSTWSHPPLEDIVPR
jgi:hypothetical protein